MTDIARVINPPLCPTATGRPFQRSHHWKPVRGAAWIQWIRKRNDVKLRDSLQWQLFQCAKCKEYGMFLSSPQFESCGMHRKRPGGRPSHYNWKIGVKTMDEELNAEKLARLRI